MSDDEDADANEQAFAELQENLKEQEDAENEANRLSRLKPGDADYDAIRAHYVSSATPDADTCEELSTLVRQWLNHRETLVKRETELFDLLSDEGYDMRDYYVKYHIKPKMQRLERDPAEKVMRVAVDSLLEKQDRLNGATQRTVSHSGAVETFVAGGASGYAGYTDDQELADVDVLDGDASADEGDRPADKIRVYSEECDGGEVDTAVRVDDSGAYWMEGFRMSQHLRLWLKEHQREAADMCLRVLLHGGHGILVAHGMGLGKTMTTLATLEAWTHRFKQARAIVCCPRSVIHQWSAQMADYESFITIDNYAITDTDAHLVRQLRPWFKHGGVVIVGHDQFKRTHTHFAIDKNTILIVDEAHVLKQNTTEFYEAIDSLPTNRKVFLTGSPVQNNLLEYYKLLQLLAPGVLADTQATFIREYQDPIENGLKADDGDDDAVDRAKIVLQQMVLRLDRINDPTMTKFVMQESSEILRKKIPPKTEYCLIHACGPVPSDASVIKERHNVHSAARPNKIQLVLALIRSIRQETTENIVVFSTRNTLLDELNKIEPGFLYTGEVQIDRRDKIMHDYPSKPGDILYIATKAGGVGLNITSASRVILADISWNPVDDNQAVARCWRMGQPLPVYVYRLVAHDTLEKSVYRLGIKKHIVALSLSWDASGWGKTEAATPSHHELYRLMQEDDDGSHLDPATCGDKVLARVPVADSSACNSAMSASTLMAASTPIILEHDAPFDLGNTTLVEKGSGLDDSDSDVDAEEVDTEEVKPESDHGHDNEEGDGDDDDGYDDDGYDDDEAIQHMTIHNIYHKLSLCSARRVFRPDGSVQLLEHHKHTLDDGTLCAPHRPVFYVHDSGEDKKDKNNPLNYSPAVCFSVNQEIYIQVGPDPNKDDSSAFADTSQVQFRLEYMQVDCEDEVEWKPVVGVSEMKPKTGCAFFLLNSVAGRPDAGHRYRFRVFMRDRATGKTTPRSEPSADIFLHDAE